MRQRRTAWVVARGAGRFHERAQTVTSKGDILYLDGRGPNADVARMVCEMLCAWTLEQQEQQAVEVR